MESSTKGLICSWCHRPSSQGDRCSHCERDPLLRGRWALLEMLGHGAFGHTWRAVDLSATDDPPRQVAIKELSFRRLTEFKQLELFQREAEMLRELDHRGIPTYEEDFVVEDDRHVSFYLVQELIEGRSLRLGDITSEQEVRRLLKEISEILIYLSDRRPVVVHRDIKPSNIMRRDDGSFVLIDFGSTSAVADATLGGSTVAGTLGYMAPEQLLGRSEAASDIYGLGATAIALLSGRDASQIIDPHRPGRWKNAVDVSPEFETLLEEMIQVDSSRRLANPRELTQRLEALDDPRIAARRRAAKQASLATIHQSMERPERASLRSVALQISRDPLGQLGWLALMATSLYGILIFLLIFGAFLPKSVTSVLSRPIYEWGLIVLGITCISYIGFFLAGTYLDRDHEVSLKIRRWLRWRRIRHQFQTQIRSASALRFVVIALFLIPLCIIFGALGDALFGSFGLGIAVAFGLVVIDQVQAHIRRRNGWHRALYPEFDRVWPGKSKERALFRKLATRLWCATPGIMASSDAVKSFRESYDAMTTLKQAGLTQAQQEHIELVLLTCHAAFADPDRLEESLQRIATMTPRRSTAESLRAACDAVEGDSKSVHDRTHQLASLYFEHRGHSA